MIPHVLLVGLALAPEGALPVEAPRPSLVADAAVVPQVAPVMNRSGKPRAVPPAHPMLALAGKTFVSAGAIGIGGVIVRLVFEGLAQKGGTPPLGVGPPCVGPNCVPPSSDVADYWSWIALASLSTVAVGSVMWALGANETRVMGPNGTEAGADSGRFSIGVVPTNGGVAGSLGMEF